MALKDEFAYGLSYYANIKTAQKIELVSLPQGLFDWNCLVWFGNCQGWDFVKMYKTLEFFPGL